MVPAWSSIATIIGRDPVGNIIVAVGGAHDVAEGARYVMRECETPYRMPERSGAVISSARVGWTETRLLLSASFAGSTIILKGRNVELEVTPAPTTPPFKPVPATFHRGWPYTLELTTADGREQVRAFAAGARVSEFVVRTPIGEQRMRYLRPSLRGNELEVDADPPPVDGAECEVLEVAIIEREAWAS